MIKLKYIIVFLVFLSTNCSSQTTFTSIDSLLAKNFETVNKRDSINYLSLINQQLIFKNKPSKTKTDSLLILNPFKESFNLIIESITDMTADPYFTVTYIDYECKNKKTVTAKMNGKIPVHVNILVNNTFTLKLPFIVYATNGLYSIIDPMMVMFVETKE